MKILYMGTPEFATAPLRRLIEDGHNLVGVFTQKDKPQNRGMKLKPSPVKALALSEGISVFTPDTLREPAVIEEIKALAPELIVVAAYGKLLPEEILNLPPLGCINVHTSLLPKLRGAAPIQWAILNGETETGVTIMHMAKALDAGDIIAAERLEIGPNETAEQLHDRLMVLGADLLSRTVEAIGQGTATRTPQDEAQATYAPMLSRSLSPMDFARPAKQLHDQVRGLFPWPGASMEWKGKRLKVLETRLTGEHTQMAPGQVVRGDGEGLRMACGNGSVLLITRLQAEGGKKMSAGDYLRGHAL